MILINWQKYLIGDPIEVGSELESELEQINQQMFNTQGDGILQLLCFDQNYLFSNLTEWKNKSGQITETARNIEAMSIAYLTPRTNYYLNVELLMQIKFCIKFLIDNMYNKDIEIYDNWWDFQIGIPRSLVNTITLLIKELDIKLLQEIIEIIKHFVLITTNDTGANLLDKAFSLFIVASIEEDKEQIVIMLSKINEVLAFVESGDGFYEDGGFIQHQDDPYNGSYGEVLITRIKDFIVCATNSDYINVIETSLLKMVINNNFMKFLYKGMISDQTLGRSVSRANASSHYQGRNIVVSLATIVVKLFNNDLTLIENLKFNMISDTFFNKYYQSLTITDAQLILTIINDQTIDAKDLPNYYMWMPSINQLLCKKQNLISVALCSERISSFETGNGENLEGWYQLAGTYNIYNQANKCYSNDYYATVNMLRLPGVTTDNVKGEIIPWHSYYNVGGYLQGLVDGNLGVCAFNIDMQKITNSNLKAKKSYYIYDDFLTCIGSDINQDCETIIENRKLEGAFSVEVAGEIIENEFELSTSNNVILKADQQIIEYINTSNQIWKVKVITKSKDQQDINSNVPSEVKTACYLEISVEHIGINQAYDYTINTGITNINKLKKIEKTKAYHKLSLNDKTIIVIFEQYLDKNIQINCPGIIIVEPQKIIVELNSQEHNVISVNLFNQQYNLNNHQKTTINITNNM